MRARAVRIESTGGPEVLQFADVDLPEPGPGEVLIRSTAIGLNFIDTYHRSGLYPVELPAPLGTEAAGVVESIGEGVTGLAPGDRVATFGPGRGAYATARIVPAAALVRLPDDIPDETAAASMLKGCTTEFLVERCGRVEAGWPVLVHAAAGGVGLLLVQWLKAVGATVIGTTGTEEKAALARAAGADHVLLAGESGLAARVRDLTGGEGVRVTFDGVGKATFETSLDATAKRGLVISFGNASGAVGAVDFAILARKGSLFATRPTLFDYYVTRAERQAGAARLFEMLRNGTIEVTVGQRYALEDVRRAHEDLEARRTVGSTLLIP
ncbi:MAG: quinone oxidoreductase family protein [Allosphingosinicella sp.]|uniref:quinone oxidoreductase family protein n=1 Tax=Allosphingosinicella sp. TaxID=2823234 RepID=UPI003931406F